MGKQLKLFDSISSGEKSSSIPKPKSDLIKQLQAQIEYYQHLYYNKQPKISDEEFDKLWDELKILDPNNEVFSKVGADFEVSRNKIRHTIPMNSQEKAVNSAEFTEWAKKVNHSPLIVQVKEDGISVEIKYLKGEFQCAVTRGDGLEGDDISDNVRKMKGFIPKVNPEFTGATRGEIVLAKDILRAKYPDAKTSRSMANGITARKDGKGCEDLTIIAYNAINLNPDHRFKNELEKLDWLKEQKFIVVDTRLFKTIKEVIRYRDEVMTSLRSQLKFDIDGLVIKGNEIDWEDMKRARPNKQIAFKFDPEEKESTVIDVIWSESGANYTPVAIIKPVLIAGDVNRRASLANPNKTEELNLKIGSKVIVSKRGDINPKIERVIFTPKNARNIQYPSICNTCNTPLVNSGTRLYCPNKKCSKRAYHRFLKWIEKNKVKNFGELILKQLFASGKIRKIADLYSLRISDLIKLDRVAEKSAKRALDNLFAVNEVSLSRFVGSFDLENIGESLVENIVEAGYDTLEKIRNASVRDLTRVKLFGDITANQFHNEFHSLYIDMVEVLKTNKIKIREVIKTEDKLDGKSFCFTGTLEHFKPRRKAEESVIENGGAIENSVVGSLDFLVTNSNNPTNKYKKAQSQENTKIISEEEYLKMIE